jgi:hypothetical protein
VTIENHDSIDGVGLDKSRREIVLLISDHLPWSDAEVHFRLLEKKIGGYLNFIQSGQMLENFPNADDHSIRISLIHKFEPNEIANKFLDATKIQLAAMNIALTYEALPEGY